MQLQDVEKLIRNGESEALEFKKSTGHRTTAAKTLCGMLNGTGDNSQEMLDSSPGGFGMNILRRQQLIVSPNLSPLLTGSGADPIRNAVPRRKPPGHDTGARGTAYLARGISVGKNRALVGDAVNVGCFVKLASHDAGVMIAVVISKNEQDVGFLC